MSNDVKQVVIVGYSGHSYVVIELLRLAGREVNFYLEKEKKSQNPYNLHFQGNESENLSFLRDKEIFVAIGSNKIRSEIFNFFLANSLNFANAIHPKVHLSASATIGSNVMISAGVSVNALASIEDGTIINTGAIVEHECKIGKFTHVAPGAVLNGNVQIGARSFIGANSVVKEGIRIGKDVIIGAGTVVIKDIPDNTKMVGNPQRFI